MKAHAGDRVIEQPCAKIHDSQDKDKTESRAQKRRAQKDMLVGRIKYDAPAI